MKRIKIAFLFFAIIAMLFMGGCAQTDKTKDGSASSTETSSQPSESQESATPSTENEPKVPSENVTLKDNYEEPDKSLISADYATEDLLVQYESYEEFFESEYVENQAKLLLKVGSTVKDFRLLLIYGTEWDDDHSLSYSIYDTLYSVDELTPEKPLFLGTVFIGLMPTRAISFVDENNIMRYFSLNMSGKDGSIFLQELVLSEGYIST